MSNVGIHSCAGVLFDVDGTLVDDDLHLAKHNHVLNILIVERGLTKLTVTEAEWAQIGGLSDQAAYCYIKRKAEAHGLSDFPDCITYLNAANRYFAANIHATKPRPGARTLIETVESQGLPLGIVTNADRKETIQKLNVTKLRRHFRLFCCLEAQYRAKPQPDLYLAGIAAIKRLYGNPALQPQRIIAIEDTVTGATAALAAGCLTILWLKAGQIDQPMMPAHPRLISTDKVQDIVEILTRRQLRRQPRVPSMQIA